MKSIKKLKCQCYLTEEEHKTLFSYYSRSTCNNLSEYLRKVILRRPVQIRYRNESLDDTMEELVDLRMDLKRIRYHLDRRLKEHDSSGNSTSSAGTLDIMIEQELGPAIAHIMERIANFSDIWSQYSKRQKV